MKNAMENTLSLIKGDNFMKYGRKGKPHQRKVWISENEDRICWRSTSKP
jgi:hypothetical protein